MTDQQQLEERVYTLRGEVNALKVELATIRERLSVMKWILFAFLGTTTSAIVTAAIKLYVK